MRDPSYEPVVCIVPSLTTRGRTYRVSIVAGEPVGCECTRALFLKRGESCTHMDLARRVKALERKCIEAHGPQYDGICCDCLAAVLALSAQHVRQSYMTKTEAKEKIAKARARRSHRAKSITKRRTEKVRRFTG